MSPWPAGARADSNGGLAMQIQAESCPRKRMELIAIIKSLAMEAVVMEPNIWADQS
jgi:hypothetical protein